MNISLRNKLIRNILEEVGLTEESFSQSGNKVATWCFEQGSKSAMISVDEKGYKVLGQHHGKRGILHTSLSARASVTVVMQVLGLDPPPEQATLRPFIMLTNIAKEEPYV
ncbi:MAG: hypothetical protein GY938_13210 [Ketobacter sp.]|nr:hypothetical protein [Ketobacter sp.]